MTGTKGRRLQRARILTVNAMTQQNTDSIAITRPSSNDLIPTQKSKEAIQPIGSIATENTFQQHPYLNFIQKRKRSYKKKLDKVIALESACAAGKVLNEQQKELVSGKPMLKRLLLELDTIRDQFIDSTESQSTPNSDTILQEEAIKAPKEASDSVIPTDGELYAVRELLKVLHIVDTYRNLQQEIPAVLDYYSQVLLGRTRPPAEISFEENLAESVDVASQYAQKRDVVFACDTTYAQLNEIVNGLVTTKVPIHTLEEAMVPQSESNGFAMSNGSVGVKEKSPVKSMADKNVATINFFTDSTLSSETNGPHSNGIEKNEYGVLLGSDMEKNAEISSQPIFETTTIKPSTTKWDVYQSEGETSATTKGSSHLLDQSRSQQRRRYQARPKQEGPPNLSHSHDNGYQHSRPQRAHKHKREPKNLKTSQRD